MRRQGDVIELKQFHVGGRGLDGEGFQGCAAQAPRLERFRQSIVVDHWPSGRIHEIGAGLHLLELLLANEPTRLLGDPCVQRHHVALAQDRFKRDLSHPISQVLGGELNIRVAHQSAATERFEDAHDLGPDMSIADHADGHLRQFLAGKIGAIQISPPLAATQAFMPLRYEPLRYEPSFGKDCADGEFGDCGCIPSRGIDDTDLPAARRSHVDVHRTPARDRNKLQLRQAFDHPSRERREVSDGDLSAVHMRHHLVSRPLIFL